MKKFFALLTALLLTLPLCVSPALGEIAPREESAEVTYEELELYLAAQAKAALDDGSVAVQTDEIGTWAVWDGGALEIADEELTESTAILGAAILPGQEDPRGLYIGCSLADVLEAYPNDNPDLYGTRYDAALYIRGEKPEATVGYVLRDGQRVTQVCHTVEHWTNDGVVECSIVYDLDQGTVIAISIVDMQRIVEESEATETLNNVAAMQENREYAAYPQSNDGSVLAPFQREDLSFSGIDFLDLTAESAIAAFGSPNLDEWTEDSTGDFLRLLQWDGIAVQLVYGADKAFLRVDSLIYTNADFEGPRGVRAGDYLDTVINRFYRENYAVLSAGEVKLYDDGGNAGLLSYSASSAALTYSLSLDEGARTVTWYMTFLDGEMQEARLLLR